LRLTWPNDGLTNSFVNPLVHNLRSGIRVASSYESCARTECGLALDGGDHGWFAQGRDSIFER
jgi:hypothetical protein